MEAADVVTGLSKVPCSGWECTAGDKTLLVEGERVMLLEGRRALLEGRGQGCLAAGSGSSVEASRRCICVTDQLPE